ncbi:ArgE/DapE family deacylase [Petroclostridium sp. X23]|uniref:ArgE/DapE family deacylase n=1 Tax=Petroclostridium sp. X23 TaxID=3045146 RepID=UPI0024AC8398|nr:ArgE/DapE family deacylase [Petroclostridium sp. X23]WHH56821.1 ArgE/DapE family deacylase [Petroclostridium sp. X23]
MDINMNQEKLMEYIESNANHAITFLQKLISFDSTFKNQGVDGNEFEAQKWLERELQQWGFETHLFEPENEEIASFPDYNPGHYYENRPNLVAISKGTGNGKTLILNGHIDTVPLDDLKKWKHDPLSGEVIDGKIFGRGACDMKAGVAAMILATKYINDLGFEHKGDIIIQSVVDEEGGGNGTLACVAKGYTADAAIVTEPTGLQLFCASRGVFLLKITVYGKPSHACFKWSGVNAIEKAIKIIQGLKELECQWLATKKNPLLPSPTITVGQIEGGISAATVPGTCALYLDIKYLPTEINEDGVEVKVNGEEVKQEVEQCIRNICNGDEWLKLNPVDLNWYLSVMPHLIDSKCPLIDIMSSACEDITGSHIISGLPSGADARHLQNNGNIPTILFGPGNMRNAHSIDEFVDINQYLNAIKILAKTILNWTNQVN